MVITLGEAVQGGVLAFLGAILAPSVCATVSTAQATVAQTSASTAQTPAPTAPNAPNPPAKIETPTITTKPATLAVDTPQQTLVLERCVPLRPTTVFAWFSRRLVCQPPRALGQFSERIFDRNRIAPIDRVFVRIDAVAKSPSGFDPIRSLAFTFNGRSADLFSGRDTAVAHIDAEGQANVRATVTNLDSGEYNVTLRFVAPNFADGDAEKVALSMFVKDEPWVPLMVVLFGVLLSFLTKKIFVATKDRLALRARIAQMDSSWLRNEPAASAVVWAQANLRLAGSLARQAWLTVPDLVNTRLADVEALLPTLRKIRDTRTSIQSSAENALAQRLALRKLWLLTARCNPPLTAAIAQQITNDLDAMDIWNRPDQLPMALWNDRLAPIQTFVSSIQMETIADSNAKAVIGTIVDDLNRAIAGAQPPPNLLALYAEFAALEVLWPRLSEPELLGKLLAAYQARHSVQELFAISDANAWQKLKEAANDGHVQIMAPSVPQQVFDPFTLGVTSGDHVLDESYLFRFKLRYRWHIELSSRRWWKPWAGQTQKYPLTPETLEPTVVQYAPRPGAIAATVTIWNGTSDSVTITTPVSFKIERSEATPLVGAMERAEFWPLVAAALIAVLTGFSTQYFGNTTFGSAKDYVTLFLTGTAVDWVKNAVQPTPSPATTPSQASPSATK
jgi:hypothetical protein